MCIIYQITWPYLRSSQECKPICTGVCLPTEFSINPILLALRFEKFFPQQRSCSLCKRQIKFAVITCFSEGGSCLCSIQYECVAACLRDVSLMVNRKLRKQLQICN
jgi:hypothetical protein